MAKRVFWFSFDRNFHSSPTHLPPLGICFLCVGRILRGCSSTLNGNFSSRNKNGKKLSSFFFLISNYSDKKTVFSGLRKKWTLREIQLGECEWWTSLLLQKKINKLMRTEASLSCAINRHTLLNNNLGKWNITRFHSTYCIGKIHGEYFWMVFPGVYLIVFSRIVNRNLLNKSLGWHRRKRLSTPGL